MKFRLKINCITNNWILLHINIKKTTTKIMVIPTEKVVNCSRVDVILKAYVAFFPVQIFFLSVYITSLHFVPDSV